MELILVPGVFLSGFLALLIFSKKGKARSDYILALLFILYGLTILLSLIEIYNRRHGYPFPAVINSSTPLIFLHGPVLWLYIKSLTVQNFRLKPVYLLHLVPFMLVMLLFSITIYSVPSGEKIVIDSSGSFKKDIFYPLIIAGIFLSTQGYYVWGIILIRRFRSKIKEYFSQIEGIDLKWLSFLIVAAIFSYLSISSLYALDFIFGIMPYGALQTTGYFIASLYIVVLGFFGLRQGNLFASVRIDLDLGKAARIETGKEIIDQKEKEFLDSLLEMMSSERPYIDPDITLSGLAGKLNVSNEYLSGVINGRLNRNFFDFINRHRVDEFKKRAADPENDNLSIIGIAWDCGFNSKATFNRVFKKMTGMTPGVYRQNSAMKA